MQIWRLLALSVWAAFALLGCQNSNPPPTTETQPMGAGDGEAFHGHVVVIPTADQSFLPEGYDFIYPMIDSAIQAWLKNQNLRVAPTDQVQAALDANGGAIRRGIQSSDSNHVSQAIAALANQLNRKEPIDLVLMPQLLINSRMLNQPYSGASWDGVSRQFVVNGERDTGQQLQVNTATLVVGVYNRMGQPEYFGRGGLDFLENATRVGTGIVTSPKRPGQISQPSVQEAVQLALGPWARSIQSALNL